MSKRVFFLILTTVSIWFLPMTNLMAQMSFKKVELRTAFGTAKEGQKGILIVDGYQIQFVNSKNGRVYFAIPSRSVTEIFYSRVAGRRIKSAIAVTPFLLFSKGKKHYMTISFNDDAALVGAVELKLDKRNYRGVLRAVEQVSGVEMKFEQEGIKDEKENVASRSTTGTIASDQMATLSIHSEPEDAEIEINGAYAGSTPRVKKLKPGLYKIRIARKGYKNWERKIRVEAGEEVPIKVVLEKK